MSTDWDLYCCDCDEELGAPSSWPDRYVVLSSAADLLAELAPHANRADLIVELSRQQVNLDWFVKHRGHRLVPRNEYGQCFDECGKDFRCGSCGHSKRCRRKKDHEGEHSEKRDDG